LRLWAIVPLAATTLWIGMAAVEATLGMANVRTFLGVDFTCFWTAGQLARAGGAALVYDPATLGTAEQAVRALPPDGILPFFYPPPYLLICSLLAMLPYWPSLALFVASGFLLLAAALWRLVPRGTGLLPILAFPGFLVTARTGQNGLLTAACLSWFAVLADRRPWLAGGCLGALACKPQLAICVPLALLAAGRWRALGGAFAAYALLCLASLAVFGIAPWLAFLRHAADATGTITGGMLDERKIMSAFVAARLLGASLAAAAAVQAAAAAAALVALLWFARRRPHGAALGGALAATSLLVAPYSTDYDLVCMAPALAAGLARAACLGFLPGDKILLIGAFLLPLLAHDVARATDVQVAPAVLAGLLFVLVRTRSAPA
jgi:hypothetical protein